MRNDALALSELEQRHAGERLTQARIDLEKARNDEGMLSAESTADAVNGLISSTRSELFKLQQEYETQKRYVSLDAPQMRNLQARINAANDQIALLQAKLTNPTEKGDAKAISNVMSKLDYLERISKTPGHFSKPQRLRHLDIVVEQENEIAMAMPSRRMRMNRGRSSRNDRRKAGSSSMDCHVTMPCSLNPDKGRNGKGNKVSSHSENRLTGWKSRKIASRVNLYEIATSIGAARSGRDDHMISRLIDHCLES